MITIGIIHLQMLKLRGYTSRGDRIFANPQTMSPSIRINYCYDFNTHPQLLLKIELNSFACMMHLVTHFL